MASTTFVNGVTLTDAAWFNDVNSVVYTLFGNGTTYSGVLTLLTADPLLKTSVSLTSHAAGSTATLTNSPAVGNPTKWIAINDNGTTRYLPVW